MLCKSLPEVMAYQNDKLVWLYYKRKISPRQGLFLFDELKNHHGFWLNQMQSFDYRY